MSASKRLRQKDAHYLGRDERLSFFEVVRAKDDMLYRSDGKASVDFLMGWCVGNLGWGRVDMQKALRNFSGPTYVLPSQLYAPWADLAELLARMTPGKLTKSFRATGGTEAVEIALQAAMAHTKRSAFVSVEGSYHGHSLGALSVGSSEFRSWYRNLLPRCYKVKPPLDGRAAQQVVRLLRTKKIAAFIAEPVIMNLGVEIPTGAFWGIVQRACRRYGTLLILDEVATGFGRTGRMFAAEHYGLKPDIMTLGKAISGGYGALGATIMTPTVARSFRFDFSYYSTYGWHPLSVHMALAFLRYMHKHRVRILAQANAMGAYLEERLAALPFRYAPTIRRCGMAINVRFSHKGYGRSVSHRAIRNGLFMAYWNPSSFTLFPSLTISKKTADKGLEILGRSV